MGRAGAKALVVDDDPGLLGIYAEVLREEGYEVDTAETGAEAARCLAEGGHDVLLCDMVLPDSSGLEIMQTARREAHDLPVVFITGHPTLQTAIVAVEKGASRYLQKPVSREDLLTTIEAVIREHRDGARERATRERSAAARRRVETAFTAALESVQTACEPVVRLGSDAVVAYCAVTADSSPGLSRSRAMVHAARRLDRLEDLGRAVRRSAAAVRRTAGQGLPLLVTVPLDDVAAGRLLEQGEPLHPLAPHVILDIWPPIPRETGAGLVGQLDSLRVAGYRLALPLPRPEAGDLPAPELGPVDYLRLESDAISSIETDPVRQALVAEAAVAAGTVGAPLVARGFATPERRALLVDLGCGLLQCHGRGRQRESARQARDSRSTWSGLWGRLRGDAR